MSNKPTGKPKGYWNKHEDVIRLANIIMKNIRKNNGKDKVSISRTEFMAMIEETTIKVNEITGEDLRPLQVDGFFMYGKDLKSCNARLRNIRISIETGYLTPELFDVLFY